MKFLLSFLLFLSVSLLNFAQTTKTDIQVPYDVRETFFAKFQKVKKAEWKKISDDLYLVTFTKGDKNLEAEFLADGKWMSTNHHISTGEVPRSIVVTMAKDMKGYKMKKALKKETYMRGLIYDIDAAKGNKVISFTFNQDGKLLYYTEPGTSK